VFKIFFLLYFITLNFVPAKAENIDQLKGLSISASWTEVLQPSVAGPESLTRQIVKKHLDLYISTIGRVFVYETQGFGIYGSHNQEKNKFIYEIDKSSPPNHCGTRSTFTFVDGHLTFVGQQLEGFYLQTIPVNTTSMSCTFSSKRIPDQQTGRVVTYTASTSKTTCTRTIILNHYVQSYECKVTIGNIFDNDSE
jgi:hypothetical protein